MLRINAQQVHADFNTTSLRAGRVTLSAGKVGIEKAPAGYGGEYVSTTVPLRAVVTGTDVAPSKYPDPPIVIHSSAYDLRAFCENVLEQLQVADL